METESRPRYATMHRSVSQLNQYEQCPKQYYLSRIERAWQKPAAWLPQGTAVHAVVEQFELSDRTLTDDQVEEVFVDSYADAVAELTEKTPNLRLWFRSGPYDGEADLTRRFNIGLAQSFGYKEYTGRHPLEVPFVREDGTKYIEAPFEIKFGDVLVKGFIDQVSWDPELKQWVVRDVKTGKKPGDGTQLRIYGFAFEDETGIVIEHGDYWMARTAKPTAHYVLEDMPSREEFVDLFGQMDQNVKAEIFPPKPEPDKCRFCPVNAACEDRAAVSF